MKFDKIKGYIKNEDIIKNLFYGVLGIIPFVLFAIYILFFSDFQLDKSISTKTVGFLSVITLIGVRIYRFIAIRIGKQNGLRVNTKLTDLEESIDSIEFELNDDTYGVVAVNELNNDRQKNRNIVLTQTTIAKLEQDRRKFNKRGKIEKVKKIEEEIEFLRNNELHDDSFIPFDYYAFEGAKSEVNSKPIDGSNVHKKIEDEGKLSSWIINVATSILGGTVGLGFAIGLPFWVIVGALFSLILSMGLTFLINFSLVYLKVNTKGYYKKRKQVYEIKKAIYDRVQELKKERKLEPIFINNELKRIDNYELKTTPLNGEKEMLLAKEEKQIVEDYCSNCKFYGISCPGLDKEQLDTGIINCNDKELLHEKTVELMLKQE